MVTTTRESERAYLLRLVEEYRGKGYEIVCQPDRDALPDFLKSYRPDMLAFGNNESVVVEVKARPLAENDADYLKSLSQSVESHPGWRFELVVLASEDNDEQSVTPSLFHREMRIQDIASGLASAKQLALVQPESALLYVWSLVEAILRLLAKSEEISLRNFDAPYLIKTLVAEGVISRDDYQFLTSVLPLRNATAHGFKVDELTANTVGELIDHAEQLLLLLNSNEAVS
jgi:hypothetical protein